MKRKSIAVRALLAALALLLGAVLLVPLLLPTPRGEITERQLADGDSRFVEIDGVSIHYKTYGRSEPGRPVFLLLHGTLATTATWNQVVGPLSRDALVIAYDRPAFGLTSRPAVAGGASPYGYEEQAELVVKLLDALGIDRAVLVGNSMGGAIAWMAAARHPDRVQALVLVDPVQNRHALPAPVRSLARTPQLRRFAAFFMHRNLARFGRYLYALSWHDPSHIDETMTRAYLDVFRIEGFERGLWELLIAARPFEELLDARAIRVPTLVIAGDDDRVAGVARQENGTGDLIELSRKIPGARLRLIERCGHVPQEERPEELVGAVREFVSGL